MITNAFSWLESYKDQFSILIQLGLLAATAILIRIGWLQAKAAVAQADAAKAQSLAAAAQSDMAKGQLDLSAKQLYASLNASNAATHPVLRVWPKEENSYVTSQHIDIVIRNLGLGPALDMETYYGANPSDAAGLYGDFLGIEGYATEFFDFERIKADCLTVRYSSAHGSRYETTLWFNSEVGYMRQHKRIKSAFEELFPKQAI
jgi:hypothetical protein